MPLTFKDLKKGDKLYKIIREVGLIDHFRGVKSPWYSIEFEVFFVEKSSNVNYWIAGEPHRKDMNGKDFREDFYLPDDPLISQNQLSKEELDRVEFLFTKIMSTENRIRDKLLTIPDIEVAGQLAIGLLEAEKKIYDTCLAFDLKKLANS